MRMQLIGGLMISSKEWQAENQLHCCHWVAILGGLWAAASDEQTEESWVWNHSVPSVQS